MHALASLFMFAKADIVINFLFVSMFNRCCDILIMYSLASSRLK